MYKFNYDSFTEENFNKLMQYYARNDSNERMYFGSVRVGDLCFDILSGDDDYIDGDLYIGGVDDGYGYSILEEGYPYTFSFDGADVKRCELSTYEEYKKMFEERATEAIEHSPEWIKKAKQELHVW